MYKGSQLCVCKALHLSIAAYVSVSHHPDMLSVTLLGPSFMHGADHEKPNVRGDSLPIPLPFSAGPSTGDETMDISAAVPLVAGMVDVPHPAVSSDSHERSSAVTVRSPQHLPPRAPLRPGLRATHDPCRALSYKPQTQQLLLSVKLSTTDPSQDAVLLARIPQLAEAVAAAVATSGSASANNKVQPKRFVTLSTVAIPGCVHLMVTGCYAGEATTDEIAAKVEELLPKCVSVLSVQV